MIFCPGNVALSFLCNPTSILLDDVKLTIKYESHNDIVQRSPNQISLRPINAKRQNKEGNRHDVTTFHGTYHGIIFILISKLLQSLAYSQNTL